MRPLLAFLAVLASLCLSQQSQPAPVPEVATIRLVASTTFGEPLRKALAILRGGHKEYRQLGDTLRFEKIPFGFYDLEVQASGFSTSRERVGIFQPEVQLWLGLFISPIDEVERAEITGAISQNDGSPRDLWVRLVPLYSSDFVEDHVTSAGTFRLRNVHPGRYVLLVFSMQGMVMTKPIEYHGEKLTLSLDLIK